jgi:hypothetical protein
MRRVIEENKVSIKQSRVAIELSIAAMSLFDRLEAKLPPVIPPATIPKPPER